MHALAPIPINLIDQYCNSDTWCVPVPQRNDLLPNPAVWRTECLLISIYLIRWPAFLSCRSNIGRVATLYGPLSENRASLILRPSSEIIVGRYGGEALYRNGTLWYLPRCVC